MIGPSYGQCKAIAVCLFLAKVVTIVAVVNILVIYLLFYKQEPFFSKSCHQKGSATSYSNFGFLKDLKF